MRGRPAKKVRKANLEARGEDGETVLPSLSPTKEFTFDVEHGGRGKKIFCAIKCWFWAKKGEYLLSKTSILYQIVSRQVLIFQNQKSVEEICRVRFVINFPSKF